MAKDIKQIVKQTIEEFYNMPYVPVGVSNRHIHLSKEDLYLLFGDNYALTPIKDLLPGQFASNEVVTIEGPKGFLEKVRVLGPTRNKSQLEISITDTFKLGVKAPINESGNLENAFCVKIINPLNNNFIKRTCGIVALRHIHISPKYAKKFNLNDKEFVNVTFDGIRKITFANTLIRVSKDFFEEMHIDVDEANAGFIKNGDMGLITKL